MASTPESLVAIILVNWNGFAYTKACLESLEAVKTPSFLVVLVDNASREHEGEQLKQLFPHIHLIINPDNLGFAGGNNVGIRYALTQGVDQVLLLNNDTLVDPLFLQEMQATLRQNPTCGIVQPLILFVQEPTRIWSAGGKWSPLLGRAITLGDRIPRDQFHAFSATLDWATGCCMLLSKDALAAAGLLNEQYFAYFEDVEWSLRLRKAGFNIGFAEKALVYHEAGAASKKKQAEGTLSPNVFYFHVRNQLFLLRQQQVLLGFPYHLLRFSLWAAYFLVRGRFQKLRAVKEGIRDGLFLPLNGGKT